MTVLESHSGISAERDEWFESFRPLLREIALSNGQNQFSDQLTPLLDWKARLDFSERAGRGYAAPGGSFTRSVFEIVRRGNASRFQSIRGGVVLELGAGMTSFGYQLSSLLGATAYIGIEPFYADVLQRSIASWQAQQSCEEDLPEAYVLPVDMRSALEFFPAGSVSLFAFGIERCILPTDIYLGQVEHQISRVLAMDGALLSFRSDLHPQGLHRRSYPFRRFDSGRRSSLLVYSRFAATVD